MEALNPCLAKDFSDIFDFLCIYTFGTNIRLDQKALKHQRA